MPKGLNGPATCGEQTKKIIKTVVLRTLRGKRPRGRPWHAPGVDRQSSEGY